MHCMSAKHSLTSPIFGLYAQCSKSMMQVADIIGVTVLFPGAVFAMAGGAIFGVGYGCLLVWIATSLGQTLAFVVGRYSILDSLSKRLAHTSSSSQPHTEAFPVFEPRTLELCSHVQSN